MLRVYVLCALLVLSSCASPRIDMGPKAAATIDQATVQNDAIADNIRQLAPYQAAGIKNNSDITRKILRLSSNEEMRKIIYEWDASYTQRLAQLSEEWKDEKAAYETQLSRNEAAYSAAKKEAETASFWLKIGGLVAAAWATLRALRGPIAVAGTAFGMPWLGTIANVVTGVGDLPTRVDRLKTLVTGSDVGIRELERVEKQIDVALNGRLKVQLKRLTGEESLAELVRKSAKAVQQMKKNHSGARKELQRVRDEEEITELHNKILQ